ncbi:type I restriction endonuclease [Lachnotalea glycerini]|uniref:Endonuclease n=1 Tax=Lachnotalea glycerini TaxID=1763509 RepID=A0A371J3Z0_9FIRM|nr:type I restriction endonuclease [Lachnotalea glycerini]RDY27511.1 endonuclease [Lachnotalea glycerini]
MNFKDEFKNFIERAASLKDAAQTEEATKMSLIVPFFQLLGYDVFNPSEFCPEYTADVGIKRGEKVDYAILLNGEPVILIEAKASNKKLDRHSSQLFRYYVATSAKFAILTNGIEYRFYTDLDEKNKMDKEPFLYLNILNLKDNQINQIIKFKKEMLDIPDIMNTASLLKYNSIFKGIIEQQFQRPSDDFVKLFLQSIYKGVKTQTVLEKFRPVLKKSLNDYLNEVLNERLQSALNTASIENTEKDSNLSTSEEWEALSIIKEILKNTVDIDKISFKYTESYIAVLYENNSRKWLCRLILTNTSKTFIVPDESKKELRYSLCDMDQIVEYSSQIINIANRYLLPFKDIPTELLHTKWGTYEMPEPYCIDLTRGPRTDLKTLKA